MAVGILVTFDYMCHDWALMVLEKNRLDKCVIARLKHLYKDNVSVILVNNNPGKTVRNIRMSLLISFIPLHGPALHGSPPPGMLEERYKIIS